MNTLCSPCLPVCSNPFDRVVVSYLLRGNTRVLWSLKPTFTDPLPFVFTLQVSQAKNPEADDWEDVGTSVTNQYAAVDGEQRLFGKIRWLFYRVQLVTNTGIYYSDPTGLEGTLPRRDWRVARELMRQELLRMRQYAGQQGYLLKRRITGTPCPVCLDPLTNEIRDPYCPTCFSGDTLIRTQTGFRPISEVKVGDAVLTIDGSYKRVTQTMRRPYCGPVYSIRTTSMTRPIIVTPEHPFYAMKSSHVFDDAEQLNRYGFVTCGPSPCDVYMRKIHDAVYRPTGATFHEQSGKWRAKVMSGGIRGGESVALAYVDSEIQAKKIVLAHRLKHLDLGHRLDWVEARDLQQRQWIATTYPAAETDITNIQVPVKPAAGRVRARCDRCGPTEFTVDADFLWMVGLYIAEGSTSKRSVIFSLHAKETEYRDRLVRYFASVGLEARVRYPKGLSMTVTVYSTTLAEWFPLWLGRGSHNKHVPEELMYLPQAKTRALIRGIWDGDGTKDTNEIGQTSEVLTLQLAELLHRLDEQPTIYTMGPRPGRKPAWMLSWKESTLVHDNRKGRWQFGERCLSRINEYEQMDYSGDVYNLEVEDNHTYVVQNLVVHNCWGTGFYCGYFFPVDCVWADIEPKTYHVQQTKTRGTTADIVVRARMLNTWMMSEEDVWVNKVTDDRYYVHTVQHVAEIRGVPIAANVELRPAAVSDPVYGIEIPNQLLEYTELARRA